MIIIKSPRYRDRTVLLARYRLPCGQDVYKVPNDVICNSPIEGMETKQGKTIAMRAIPLDAMERVE